MQNSTTYAKETLLPDLTLENQLWLKGFRFVAGIDEVGRGAWAGPLVVGGVILPQDFKIPEGLADSKIVSAGKRIKLAQIIKKVAVATSIIEISAKSIDKIRITRATQEAFRKIVKNLKPAPDFCLIDAFYIKHFSKARQEAVKGGDKICASIAAASIIAKVHRDDLMTKLHFKYPDYGFDKHKGYGTKIHQDMIKKFGFTKIHRLSFDLRFLSS